MTVRTARRSSTRRRARVWAGWALPLVPCLVSVALYSGTFDAPFIYDDISYVERNPLILEVAQGPKLWVTSYPPGSPAGGLYRPVTATSYLVDHQLFGMNPSGFHVTNVLVYAVAVFMLFWVCRSVGCNQLSAFLVAVLFAVHAVHVESVAWIVGRAEVLAGLFCFVAVLAWARFRRGGRLVYLGLAAVAYFLGLGAKETAAPLPAVLLAAEYFGLFSRRSDSRGRESVPPGAPRRSLVETARSLVGPFSVLAAAFAAYTALRIVALGRFGAAAPILAFAGDAELVRWATALACIAQYARLVLLPIDLRIDYSVLKTSSFLSPEVLLGLAIAVALAGMAIWAGRRAPRTAFWIWWYILFLLPVSHFVVEVQSVLAERFLFIGSAGACAVAGSVLAAAMAQHRPTWIRISGAVGTLTIVAGMCLLTVDRNRDWHDAERFWRTAVEQHPEGEKAHLNLGTLLWSLGKERGDDALLDEADQVLRDGLARSAKPGFFSRDHGYMLFELANHLRQRGRTEEAVSLYERLISAIERIPPGEFPINRADVFIQFGVALDSVGRYDDALRAYRQVVELGDDARLAAAHSNIGLTLMRKGDFEAALQSLLASTAADPTFSDAWLNLGICYGELRRFDEAFAAFSRAGEGLGAAVVTERARLVAQRAVRRAQAEGDPGRIYRILELLGTVAEETAQDAYYKGIVAQQLGRADDARRHLQRALALDRDHGPAREALRRLQ